MKKFIRLHFKSTESELNGKVGKKIFAKSKIVCEKIQYNLHALLLHAWELWKEKY